MTRITPRDSWNWTHLGTLLALPGAWLAATHWALPTAPTMLVWLALCASAFALTERVRPFRQDWHADARQLRRDGSVLAMNVLADGVTGALIAAAAVAWLPGQSAWPLGVQIVVGALLAELGSYAVHRLSHREGWLWRAHLLHHRPERVNTPNAMTAHPLNAAYDKLARTAPLVLLGLDPTAVLAIGMFTIAQVLATHANVRGTIGPLNWLIGSAELHRLHHSRAPLEAGNFGTALPLWDQLFGTYRYGVAPSAVGVFDSRAYPGEFELKALLAWPFAGLNRLLARRFGACCARCCG